MNILFKQYRNILVVMLLLLIQGCATTSDKEKERKNAAISEQRSEVIKTAKSQLGVRYRFGGSSPAQGFDCSGLLQYSFSQAGLNIPRTTRSQAQYFETTDSPEVGDVLFFKINRRNVSHAGIYLGNNKMLHAPSSGGHVEITDIREPYWQERFYKFGRSKI